MKVVYVCFHEVEVGWVCSDDVKLESVCSVEGRVGVL